MFCKKCGNQIPDDSDFCEHCGARLKGAKMEDVLRDADDADGDSYIAVNTKVTEVPKKELEVPGFSNHTDHTDEDEQPKKGEFMSFVEIDEEKKSNKGLWIAVGLIAVIAIVGIAFFFVNGKKGDKKENTLSEQTNANAQLVTTVTQTETQLVDENNGYFERTYSDGSTYKGNFKDGLWEGEGVYTSTKGIVYSGTFTQGAVTGSGKITYTNGDVYEGAYKNAQRDGKGTLYYHDGNKYIGSFVVDKRSGYGQMWYTNGDYFSGKFSNDLKHGNGEYTYASGDKYEGEYKNNLPDGDGVMNFANGAYYKGDFKAGKRSGYGEYHFANGDVLTGNWSGDDITGTFTYFNSETGQVKDTEFKDGKPVQ